MKKTITLIELLIAISLLLLIVLGAGTFHVASERFLRSSETKVSLVNELTYILEHMNKYISLATGDVNNPGITLPDSIHLRIRVDLNSSPTPEDYTDDIWIEYRLNSSNRSIEFCSDYNMNTNSCRTSYETLSSRLINLSGCVFSVSEYNRATLSGLILRFNPVASIDPSYNPQLGISPATLSFTSISHSTN